MPDIDFDRIIEESDARAELSNAGASEKFIDMFIWAMNNVEKAEKMSRDIMSVLVDDPLNETAAFAHGVAVCANTDKFPHIDFAVQVNMILTGYFLRGLWDTKENE